MTIIFERVSCGAYDGKSVESQSLYTLYASVVVVCVELSGVNERLNLFCIRIRPW